MDTGQVRLAVVGGNQQTLGVWSGGVGHEGRRFLPRLVETERKHATGWCPEGAGLKGGVVGINGGRRRLEGMALPPLRWEEMEMWTRGHQGVIWDWTAGLLSPVWDVAEMGVVVHWRAWPCAQGLKSGVRLGP